MGRTRHATEELRRKRNREKRRIQRKVLELQVQSLERLADELATASDIVRMFEFQRIFKRKSTRGLQLKDEAGLMAEAPAPLLKLTTDFYREFFNKPGMETVDRWGDHGPTPLTIEISVAEVAYAASKLKNGKAPGPDGIPCELLKYAGMEVKIKIAETLNKMFATQDPLLLLGNGLLIVLNKPGKERVVTNTRPITLLNAYRKLLSLIALFRLQPDLEKFVSPAQCGFRRRRSTTDIAWAYSWLKANSWKYQRAIHVVGIDMSKAFDTVDRRKLMAVIDSITDVSTARIIRVLISGTTLRVTVQDQLGEEFTTSVGIPQGDGLSPVLFIIYLEATMREVRTLDAGLYSHGGGQRYRWGESLTETKYADDVDFICMSLRILHELVSVNA